MRWARSRLLGTDVEATSALQWPGSFVCPLCGRPVVVRSGPIVPPYFAHRRGEGTVDCENYHPPASFRFQVYADSAGRSTTGGMRESAYLAIRGHAPNEVELLLRIPRADLQGDWTGAIAFDTGFGTVSITQEVARRGSWISVAPMSQYGITASGVVDPRYASAFYDAHLSLSPTGSIFLYSEAIQPLLMANEPLCWGNNYWLVGHAEGLRLSMAPRVVDLTTIDLRAPWVIALLRLPSSDSLTAQQKQAAERWLNRSIRVGRDTFSFLDPLPHHFDADGTPVFREDQNVVRFQCPTGARLQVVSPTGSPSEVRVDTLADTCELVINRLGTWNLFVAGRDAGQIRVQVCEFLEAPTVTLMSGNESALCPSIAARDLLERAVAKGNAVHLRVALEVLCQLVTVNGQAWPEDAGFTWTIATSVDQALLINVQGLGSISVGAIRPHAQRDDWTWIEPRCAWLWSVSVPPTTPGGSVRIHLPTRILPLSIRRLEARRWNQRFAAHVRAVETDLAARTRDV